MSKEAEIWNLAEASEKHRLMRQISRLLPGLYAVSIKPRRKLRTLDANAYYFAAVVAVFRDWLIENWGENVTLEQAHETLKLAVLDVPEVNGVKLMPRTRTMDKAEFAQYIDDCIGFVATKCDLCVIPADLYYEVGKDGTKTK